MSKEEPKYISFYKRGKVIDRKTYHCSYGSMIRFAKQHGKKIGADSFWQFKALRRFNIPED